MTQLYIKKSATDIKQVALGEGESVLNGLLRSGVEVPYGCRSGVCQSCILQSVDSEVPQCAQAGLREVQKQQGYFLSCRCQPTAPMIVSVSSQAKRLTTRVLEKRFLSPDIVRLRLEKVTSYFPGQYMTLWKNAETPRSYSLASHPTADDFLEFHIQVYADSAFSTWVANGLGEGDEIHAQGPMGNCIYTLRDREKPLFLTGVGTGLAPLYGIARDALYRGHTGRILMLHGAHDETGVYYREELTDLERRYPNFEVRRSIRNLPPELVVSQGWATDIYATTEVLLPDFNGIQVFMCGDTEFVQKMRKQCFMAGANFSDINTESFLRFPA